MDVVLIAAGVVAIAAGFLGKNFEVAQGITLAGTGRKSPTWLGRLVFFLAGASLIGIGVRMLLSGN
jgi:hypothetical protein